MRQDGVDGVLRDWLMKLVARRPQWLWAWHAAIPLCNTCCEDGLVAASVTATAASAAGGTCLGAELEPAEPDHDTTPSCGLRAGISLAGFM